MKIYQKLMSATIAIPLFFGSLMADTTTTSTTTNEIPIPNGNQVLNGQTPATVDAIVTDSQGNMTEQQLPYNAQNQTVTVNNNYGGDDSSIFFPLFEAGFMFSAGYWVGHDGNYWNGSHYVHVSNVNWNNHWNNYWHHSWAPKWNQYSHQHYNNEGSKYHNQRQNWHDHAGNWHNQGGGMHGEGNRGGGFQHDGGRSGGGGHR